MRSCLLRKCKSVSSSQILFKGTLKKGNSVLFTHHNVIHNMYDMIFTVEHRSVILKNLHTALFHPALLFIPHVSSFDMRMLLSGKEFFKCIISLNYTFSLFLFTDLCKY